MWSSRLFWKVLAGFVGLIGLSAVVFGVLVTDRQEKEMSRQLGDRLRVSAVLLGQVVASSLDDDSPAALQEIVRDLSARTETRLTVIALDGRVLADSMKESLDEVAKMTNHRDRSELIEAVQRGVGSSERFSTTIGESFLYRAVRVDRDQKPIALARVSLPVRQLQQYYDRIRGLVWLLTSLVTLFAIVVGYALVARIINPLTTLTYAAERIADGDRHQPIRISNRDEIGMLATSFNRMNVKLGARIDELRERRDQLAAVLGGMDEGVIALDDQAKILFANEFAGRLFDFDAARSQGRPLTSTVRDEKLREAVQKAIAERSLVVAEIELRGQRSGTLSVHVNPLPGEPCPGVIVVLGDRTELRRLESLRQDFVANVSHELKTPLSSIKAYAETLRNGAIHDDDHNLLFVQRIEDQADRLYQLILDLLSLARIESGQETYETCNVLVQPIVATCLERHQAVANGKSIRLITEEPDSPISLRTDDEALLQILDNLVTNAIKYTPAAGEVLVRWCREEPMGLIEVRDTGIGIAAEDKDRLFERFFRVDKARSRELGGTGLGLSIVKHLAQFFGGSVGVESQPGQGSTFWVRLPLE